MSSSERAQEKFQRAAASYEDMDKSVGGAGWVAENQTNIYLGRNVLHEELGYFGPWEGTSYSLEQDERDRLLAHTRQDVASAFAMARSSFREAHSARRLATRAVWLIAASVTLNAAILATLWLAE